MHDVYRSVVICSACYSYMVGRETSPDHVTKGTIMSTSTVSVVSFKGIPQAEARKELNKYTRRIKAAVKAIGNKSESIGRELNDIKASGLAVAAADDIEGSEREWSVDGRTTAVSAYIDTIDGLTRTAAFKYMQTAQRNGELVDAGIDPTPFADSAFRSVSVDTKADAFVDVVKGMLAADDPTITAAAFTAAGREAGIVPPAKAGGGGSQLMKASNAMLQQLKKATADDVKLTKVEATLLKRIVKGIEALTV